MLGVNYVRGTKYTLCSEMKLKSILDPDSCKEAANSLGIRWNSKTVFSPNYPSGCFGLSHYIAFNEDVVGGRTYRPVSAEFPICHNIKGKLTKYLDCICDYHSKIKRIFVHA